MSKIAIDIDNTICNTSLFFDQMAEDYDKKYINYICYLIENHDTKIEDKQIKENYEVCLKLYEIQRCDALAHHPDKLEKRKKYIDEIYKKLLLNKGS